MVEAITLEILTYLFLEPSFGPCMKILGFPTPFSLLTASFPLYRNESGNRKRKSPPLPYKEKAEKICSLESLHMTKYKTVCQKPGPCL